MNILLLVPLLFGQPPTHPTVDTGNIVGQVHQLIEIRVTPAPPEGFDVLSQEWLILSQDVSWRQYESGAVLVATAPPGRYEARWRVQYVDWVNKRGQADYRVYVITVEGPRPPPVVYPTPVDPIPPPAPGKRLAVIVYESSQSPVPLHVHRARQVLETQGHQVRVVDKDVQTGTGTVPAEVRASIEIANATGIPALVVSAGGSVIRSVRLPATADEVVREVVK